MSDEPATAIAGDAFLIPTLGDALPKQGMLVLVPNLESKITWGGQTIDALQSPYNVRIVGDGEGDSVCIYFFLDSGIYNPNTPNKNLSLSPYYPHILLAKNYSDTLEAALRTVVNGDSTLEQPAVFLSTVLTSLRDSCNLDALVKNEIRLSLVSFIKMGKDEEEVRAKNNELPGCEGLLFSPRHNGSCQRVANKLEELAHNVTCFGDRNHTSALCTCVSNEQSIAQWSCR